MILHVSVLEDFQVSATYHTKQHLEPLRFVLQDFLLLSHHRSLQQVLPFKAPSQLKFTTPCPPSPFHKVDRGGGINNI